MKFFSQRILVLSFLLAMFMVSLEVSLWMALFSFVILIWKWGSEYRAWKVLPRKLTGALSILLLIQVLIQFRTLVGAEPAYTFLLGLSALRVMDYQGEGDHKFVILLGFMLVSVKALFNFDVYWLLPSIISLCGFWYVLLPREIDARFKLLAKIFALSIPGALILFFVFPRFVLPWAISRGGNAYGQVGFVDEMNPGRFAALAGGSSLVLRAKIYDSRFKKASNLYWRGSVLGKSNGLSWYSLRIRPQMAALHTLSDPAYEVAIEPSSQNFLFVLEGTQAVKSDSGRVVSLESGLFRTARPITNTLAYSGFTGLTEVAEAPPGDEMLKIPQLSGRVLEWVEKTKKENKTLPERIEALRKFFSDSGFVYTINPGTYGAHDLENFLFIRKKGFCEHYAGAYATLARALGIPARVVGGYQGGIYNPVGTFWKISQKDAHAWVDIYNENTWQRVDPTDWIAPLRLSIGADAFFGLSEEDQKAFAKNPSWKPPSYGQFLWWDQVTLWVDDLNYRWVYFLIEFDRSSQQNFLGYLLAYKGQTLFVIIIALIALAAIFRTLLKGSAKKNDEQILLAAVESWASERQLPRSPSEPPLSYLERVSKKYPEMKDVLVSIREFYDQNVYQGKTSSNSFKELLHRWKKAVR